MVKQWEIYFLNLNPVIGSEQAGTRPAIVVSSNGVNHLNQITVLPITSIKNPKTFIYPNEVFLDKKISNLSKDSVALAHQIRTIDKQRLVNYVGMLKDKKVISQIGEAIKFQLDLA